MAFYRLMSVTVDGAVGDTTENRYGHPCEIREDGIYADIADDVIEGEITAGRVAPIVKEKPAVKAKEDTKSFDEAIATAEEVVKEGTGARKGRPAGKAK